jgi:hypothetical protein
VFGSVGRPVGKTAASSPPWRYADARVCTELKLVRFGDFQIQFWVLCFGIPGDCLTSVSPICRWSDVGIGGRGEAVCFPYLGLCFCLLIYVESGYTFLFVKSC